MSAKNKYDVAIVGGGPAGSASAYHAAKLGLKTILFEKKAYPRTKPCGGALSARCLPLLGEQARDAINCDVEETRLYSPSFKTFTVAGLPGHLVRREEFDHAMAKDARDAGATLMDNCRVKTVTPLLPDGYEISANGDTFTAKYVILATGFQRNALKQSPVKREKYEKDYLAMTVVSETPIDNKVLEEVGFSKKILGIFFGAVPNGYGWYFVKDGYLNIGIGASAHLIEDEGAAAAYHRFITTLKKKGLLPGNLELAKERLFPLPFKRTARETVFGNLLMVGDFAGFVSPVTGEGLYYAIKGGQLAADAIHQNINNKTPLSTYQQNWQQEFGVNLNKYGYILRERVYKSKRRMELVVTLGKHDRKMGDILGKMIFGIYDYKETMKKTTLRLPVSLYHAARRN